MSKKGIIMKKKSKFRLRRENEALCPRCYHPDYIEISSGKNLSYVCTKCRHKWSDEETGVYHKYA